MRSSRAALVMLLATLGVPIVARAQTPSPVPANGAPAEDAEALISRGVALRQEGKDAEALGLFRRAFEVSPTPRARAQVGLVEQALGMWLRAEEDLLAALAQTEDAWVKRYRQPLEDAVAVVRGRLGSLEIVVNVSNAEVLVDGAKAGNAPAPGAAMRVVAGTRTVVVQADGHHPVSRSVVVPGGGVARETFDLAPALAPTGPRGIERGQGQEPGSGIAPESSGKTVGWALIIGGGGVVVAGIAAQVARELGVAKYNDSACPGEGVRPQPPDCEDRISSARTLQTVAIVGYVAGGALAITGSILVVAAPVSAPKKTASLLSACGPSAMGRGAGLMCAATF